MATGTGRRLRGALIGYGFIGAKGHVPAYLRRDDVEIVAVADICEGRRALVADQLPRAAVYDSSDALLDAEGGRLDFVDIATPKLTELGQRTGETVNLAVLSGDRVLYLIRLRNSDLVTANIQVGSTLPAVHTSIGKLLLAYLDEADLAARITDSSFSANSGPNAKVSLAELREELRTIRDQGWSMQDEELAYGLRSVAAPITGPDGRVLAGVNLAVQAQDWSTQRIIRELRSAVLAACAEISALVSDTSASSL